MSPKLSSVSFSCSMNTSLSISKMFLTLSSLRFVSRSVSSLVDEHSLISPLSTNTLVLQSSLSNGTSPVVDSLSATTLLALRRLLRLLLVLSSLAHHHLRWTLHLRHSTLHHQCSALLHLTRAWTPLSHPTTRARRTTKNPSLPLHLCLLTHQQIPF